MPQRLINLKGPAKLVADCATVLLVASGMLGVEAGILIILRPNSNAIIKPFMLLGFLEICAIFFALLGIIGGIIGLILHSPYRFVSDKIYLFRARHTREVSNEYIYFEDVRPAQTHNPEEHGAPD